jgi:hypothetical protein
MTSRRRTLVVASVVTLFATRLEAQRYTLDSVVTHVDSAMRLLATRARLPTLEANYNSARNVLRADPVALQLGLDDMAAIISRTTPSVATIARWDPTLIEYSARPGFRTLLLQLVNVGSTAVRIVRDSALADTGQITVLYAPIDKLQTLVLQMGIAVNQAKLRRYEIKYGPDAPPLYAAEVFLNAATQWLPSFGPDANGWTGPNEFILAYRTVEAAFNEKGDSAKLVSAGQFGVRHFLWAQPSAARNRLLSYLKPRHTSLGLTITSSSDKPLVRPWGAGNRLGAFLGYGEVHAAYLFEKPRRILVGTGKQFIPYAF